MEPVVSVVMPVYDGQRYLAGAIESILGQTLQALELVVVDDGSTDATPGICAAYAARDPRVRLERAEHAGISRALNRGLALARGGYVARMDADDLAHPERLAVQAAYLDAHPEVVAVGTAVERIDPEGATLWFSTPPLEHEAIEAELLVASSRMVHPSVMLRRDAALRVGGYRPEFDYVEDQDLWLRLGEVGRLANLPAPLLRYREHLGSVCKNRPEEQRALLLEMVIQAHRRRGLAPPDDLAARLPRLARKSEYELRRFWLRRAIKAGQGAAAVKHAWRLFRERPWSRRTWRMLPRVLARPHFLAQAALARRSRDPARAATPVAPASRS